MSNLDQDNNVLGVSQAAIDAGIGLANIDDRVTHVHVDDDGSVPVALVPNGMQLDVMEGVLKVHDERAPAPRRLCGTSAHQELESFITHVNAFKDASSVVFSDVGAVKLTAIYDYNQPNRPMTKEQPASVAMPRWGKHRAVYACPLSREWQLWMSMNEKPMSQDKFSQFIEDNMKDLANPAADDVFPPPAAVLEMSRKLSINIQGQFSREINQTTGESSLINKTEHGPNSTKIHRAFLLGIPVFLSGEPWRVEARIRFSLDGGIPRFSYSLYQADETLRKAFDEVRAQVKAETGIAMYAGAPENA